mgnify:CR=1 FL=1
MIWVTFGILSAVALTICGCSLTRVGYETAAYQVSMKDSRFEIREYPADGQDVGFRERQFHAPVRLHFRGQ